MRSLRKRIGMLLVSCMLLTAGVAGSSSSADAKSGTWKHNKAGYWYEYADGSYAMNQWLQYDGKWYYFNAKGYMQTGWLKKGGKWYYFNPKTGAMVTGWKKIDGKYYFFKTDGTMAAGEYCHGYWLNKNGTCTSEAKASWRKSGKNWWFGDTNGWYAKKQWIKIDDKTYYFDAKGFLVTNQWIGKYCVGADGAWVPDASKEWAYAYKQAMIEYADYNSRTDGLYFEFIYLDDNSTPEMLMSVNFHSGTPSTLVSYQNGNVLKEEIGSFNYGIMRYKPYKGMIYYETEYHYFGSSDLYELKNGTLSKLGSGSYLPAENVEYQKMRNPDSEEYWQWNDTYYTKQGYYDAIDKTIKDRYGDLSYGKFGKSYDYSGMINYLNSILY